LRTTALKICEVCKIEFDVPVCELKRPGRGRFCSQPCRGKGLTIPIEERFLEYVGETTSEGCIIWKGCTNDAGYGIIRESTADGNNVLAHRYAFVQAGGVLEDGQCALHHCDNPPCINPEHLYAGTRDDNAKDRVARNRGRKGETIPWAKLKNVDIPVIQKLIKDGVPYTTIQKTYPVAISTFSQIKHGQRWKGAGVVE
jgi:hypothetical protein